MKPTPNPYEIPRLRWAAVIAALLVVLIGSIAAFQPLSFKNPSSQQILGLLTTLLLIALFIERGLEFFVELWRGANKSYKEHMIEQCKKRLALLQTQDGKKNTMEDEREKLRNLEHDLQLYKAITTRIALWTSFLVGLVVSTVGVRSLTGLFESSNLAKGQVPLFYGIDIVLTACLISGGSEGIHKIMRVYNHFMDQSAKNIAKR